MPDFETSDGVRLHYEDEGIGSPILCLSGLSRNSSDFDYVAPYLGGNRLIMLDYRGRGQSDWADPETYVIPREAGDAIELLDHLDIDQTAILGTSRGGLIAMALAATAKHRLSGVALNDIGPVIEETGMEKIVDYLGERPAATDYESAAKGRARLMPGFGEVPEGRWDEEVRRHFVEDEEGLNINYDPRLKDAVIEARAQPMPDLWPLFGALADLPLALIRGANSNILSRETAEKMQELRPDMIFADVPERGHVPFLDEDEALDALDEWVRMLP